jgi:hypothetical protein
MSTHVSNENTENVYILSTLSAARNSKVRVGGSIYSDPHLLSERLQCYELCTRLSKNAICFFFKYYFVIIV